MSIGLVVILIFFFKQKTAYEMRISDWSSDVCSSDLTSATAASSGSDINGMAALAACNTIQGRLVDFAAEHWGVPESQVEFLPGFVRVGNQKVVFADFIEAAYMARVSLSSTGFYKTPTIHWDRQIGTAPGRERCGP